MIPTIQIQTPALPDTNALYLTEYHGIEQLSSLWHYRITVYANHPNLADILLTKSITLHIKLPNQTRTINGMINAIHTTGQQPQGWYAYQICIAPAFWQLTATCHSRLFCQKTVLQIIQQLLATYTVGDLEQRLATALPTINTEKLKQNYAKLRHCAQYNESDFAFIERCLTIAGIHYYWDTTQQNIILADTETGFIPASPDLAITTRNNPLLTAIQPEPTVIDSQTMNFAQAEKQIILTAQSHELNYQVGQIIQYQNKAYLLTQITHHNALPAMAYTGANIGTHHQSNRTQYINYLSAIPIENIPTISRFNKTTKPTITGTQTASVVASDLTRVKICYRWDETQTATDWLPVVQQHAGTGFGAQFIPPAGQEVIVACLHHDPDQPIVLGTVYHPKQSRPQTWPTDRYCSGIVARKHRIAFDDTPSRPKTTWMTGGDLHWQAKNRHLNFLQQSHTSIQGNAIIRVKQGRYTLSAKTEIQLQAGSSVLRITADSITLKSPSIQLNNSN